MSRQWLSRALGLSKDDTPFPWQCELLQQFRQGSIGPVLDIPTGLGKTAVIAIWLVARACGAMLPRRLVYVVDRRAVVDQATEEALRLRQFVEDDSDIKERLGLNTRALPISTLRGQFVDTREWLEDPAAPAIIVGTVDMVGSRVLFEGYGVSRRMRPYHAGLLGADTLVVLDEAHLVPPFEKLLDAIASDASVFGPCDEAGRNLIPSFKLLCLSATGRSTSINSYGLTDRDLEHPVVKKRLEAKKHLILKSRGSPSSPSDGATKMADGEKQAKEKADFAAELAREAWALTNDGMVPSRIIVFCNSREVTVKARNAVEDLAKGDKKAGTPAVAIASELFVGGRRVFDREQAKKRLEDLGFIAGNNVQRAKPAYLFATSAAEVGVDLDADHMVCDLVAWERMVQRLGRVNRRGDGEAKVVVVVELEPKPKKNEREALEKKIKGQSLEEKEQKLVDAFEARVRQRKAYQTPFECLPKNREAFDASPGALRKLKQDAETDKSLKKLLDAATTPAPLRPALTRALVDAWSMTSLDEHTGRPAVDPWLRGWIEDDPPQTTVVWRMHLPVRSGPKEPTKKEIEAFFEAAPPHMSEKLETETFRVLDWLTERAKTLREQAVTSEEGDTETARPDRGDVVAFVLARDGALVRTLRLRDLDDTDKKRTEDLKRVLSHATLIVAASLAGLKDGLLDGDVNTPPRTADGQEWLGNDVIRFRVRSTCAGEVAVSDPNWRERLRFAVDISEEGEARRWLIVEKWRHDAATEEDRSAARPQLLDKHQRWAMRRALRLGRLLQLPKEYRWMLAVAVGLHDEGKRAKRWQRAFNAAGDGVYAKTKGPINYVLLDGYRHELGSLPYAECDGRLQKLSWDLHDLALHLIAAHHGFARPVIGTSGCENAPPSTLEQRAGDIALRFARLQKRWGPWGLAWWEALLRAADQQASRDNDAD